MSSEIVELVIALLKCPLFMLLNLVLLCRVLVFRVPAGAKPCGAVGDALGQGGGTELERTPMDWEILGLAAEREGPRQLYDRQG